MKFHLQQPNGYFFTGMGPDYVEINHVRYDQNLILLPDQLLSDWAPEGFNQLTSGDFTDLFALRPEVVLLGSGNTIRFPAPSLTQHFLEAAVGLEVMDNAAVCRTFNILSSEGRRVAAVILFT